MRARTRRITSTEASRSEPAVGCGRRPGSAAAIRRLVDAVAEAADDLLEAVGEVPDQLEQQEAVAAGEAREPVLVAGAEVVEVGRQAAVEGHDGAGGHQDLAPVEHDPVAVQARAGQAQLEVLGAVRGAHGSRRLGVDRDALGHEPGGGKRGHRRAGRELDVNPDEARRRRRARARRARGALRARAQVQPDAVRRGDDRDRGRPHGTAAPAAPAPARGSSPRSAATRSA